MLAGFVSDEYYAALPDVLVEFRKPPSVSPPDAGGRYRG
jgi:hypothetical protein